MNTHVVACNFHLQVKWSFILVQMFLHTHIYFFSFPLLDLMHFHAYFHERNNEEINNRKQMVLTENHQHRWAPWRIAATNAGINIWHTRREKKKENQTLWKINFSESYGKEYKSITAFLSYCSSLVALFPMKLYALVRKFPINLSRNQMNPHQTNVQWKAVSIVVASP